MPAATDMLSARDVSHIPWVVFTGMTHWGLAQNFVNCRGKSYHKVLVRLAYQLKVDALFMGQMAQRPPVDLHLHDPATPIIRGLA